MKHLLSTLLLAALVITISGCATQTTTTQTTYAPPPGPSVADIQAMAQARLSDSIIISQINNSAARYYLTADQIITLKDSGVSEAVINVMLSTVNKPSPQPITTTTTVTRPPAVYVTPAYAPYGYYGPYGPWCGPWYGPGPRVYVRGYYR